jgi:hypothetical protein
LKSFLKDLNGVDLYKNVEVHFISGKRAVLTIFEGGRELEKITLSDYNDKEKLHTLFAEKGFVKYTGVELAERRKVEAEETGSLQKTLEAQRYSLSKREQKLQMKERLKKLQTARDNYMIEAPFVEQ